MVRSYSTSSARRLLLQARRYEAAGQPLPVDLQTRLMEAGFDPSALEG